MGKLVIVKDDPVQGTDRHNVSGSGTNPPATTTLSYSGVGNFSYVGRITDRLSDFVRLDGRPVALVTSQSSLDPGQDTLPAGKHSGPAGSGFVPSTTSLSVVPTEKTLMITDKIGTGVPNADAGSDFVTVDKVKVLLDADKIDTCSGTGEKAGSTVMAQGQNFVTCVQ